MVVDEMLSSGPVENIVELIESRHFPEDTFLLLERQPDEVVDETDKKARQNLLRFTHLYPLEDVIPDIQRATSGRVFQEGFELRWEKLDQGYQAVYVGEERKIPVLKQDNEALKGVTRKSEANRYYLFGTKLDTRRLQELGLEEDCRYFAEVRVPRLLRYPIETDALRVQLLVREYVDDATGQVQLFRFQGLREAEEKA